jgi:F0F1-type ATP synthase delta subunit
MSRENSFISQKLEAAKARRDSFDAQKKELAAKRVEEKQEKIQQANEVRSANIGVKPSLFKDITQDSVEQLEEAFKKGGSFSEIKNGQNFLMYCVENNYVAILEHILNQSPNEFAKRNNDGVSILMFTLRGLILQNF